MAQAKPYFRIVRPFSDGLYTHPTNDKYIDDCRFATDRIHFVRAYRLIELDFLQIFDYVEPADAHLLTYSHQLYQVLLRACTEFEANAKRILEANAYAVPGRYLNITDYFKLQRACRLSEYEITTPVWNGTRTYYGHSRFGAAYRPTRVWNGIRRTTK